MPTYEYACRDCGEHLEVVQSFKDDPLTTCPGCQGSLRKVFSAAGLIFKGSGWHVKDYATPARSGASRDGDRSTSADGSKGSSTGKDAAGSTSTSSKDGASTKERSGSKDSATSKSSGDNSASAGSSSGTSGAQKRSA